MFDKYFNTTPLQESTDLTFAHGCTISRVFSDMVHRYQHGWNNEGLKQKFYFSGIGQGIPMKKTREGPKKRIMIVNLNETVPF